MLNHLYGLTVQGIQSYIFSTNKLKEIIGASELVEEVCTSLFTKFVKNDTNGISYLQAAGNIRYKTSKDCAKKLMLEFGLLVNKTAPGLPFSQAIVEIIDNDIERARKLLESKLRAERNRSFNHVALGTMARSKQRRTGEFAYEKVDNYDDPFLDEITYAKYKKRKGGLLVGKIDKKIRDKYVFPKEFSNISKGGQHSWLALIHIDGNGMGTKIQGILSDKKIENKFDTLKEFSKNVGEATLKAFNKTIQKVFIDDEKAKKYEKDKKNRIILPFRPLILGGDDVTIVMRADFALKFTKNYLAHFEEETTKANINLTACAGIAYVKEKFPFHYSANLAEELCVYAKNQSKREASCVQFHRVQDAIIDNYKEVRKRELTPSQTLKFINGPYYIDKYETKKTIGSLTKDITKLKKEDAPTNGMREWIDASFNNPTMADTLMKRLIAKTRDNDYSTILENKEAFMDYHTLLAINTKTD